MKESFSRSSLWGLLKKQPGSPRPAPASPGVLNRSPVRARPGRAPGLQDGVPRPAHLRPRAGGEEASLDEWGFVRRQPRLPSAGTPRTTEAVCERNGNEPQALPKEPHPLPCAGLRNAGQPERNPRWERRSRASETPLRRTL
ncbi:uncharacterized protein [Symphalangus syndactylus]|uniref:uncharacterized protein n=1 Tax=Symphalangus syndactylus TaxID=9590 RepID=UPI003004703D